MNWANFSRIINTSCPWTYDCYAMNWDSEYTKKEFLDLVYSELGDVNLKYLRKGQMMYFMIKKGTTLTDAFSSALLVADSPIEPPPEPEE